MAKSSFTIPRMVPSAKNIGEMTPSEIEQYLLYSKQETLRRLKAKWKEEAKQAGVEFGSVMLFKE